MVVFSQLIPPAKNFSSAFYEIKKGMASYERINTILDQEEVKYHETLPQISKFENSIEFKDVSFRYENSDKNAISKFNFKFEKGKKYALVGASGAGKSTLIDLLLGFYTIHEGSILLDGIPIDKLSLQSYRNLLGLVSQEAVLFNCSIAENIGFETINSHKVEAALNIGNATEFAHRLSNKNIGERGAQLSGGEKQRLTISRIAYKDPEIVLMDEATSALDSKNETEVQSALDKLLSDKTSIIIAHRLSTVKNADSIILLEDGKIETVGSHEDLYQSSTTYKNMVDLQKLE